MLYLVDIRRYDRTGGTPRLVTGLAAVSARTPKEAKDTTKSALLGCSEWEFVFTADRATPEQCAQYAQASGFVDLRS